MIIRKLFKFEGAHIVRNCLTAKCRYSVHGHSYRVEVLLTAEGLDRGQMVVDFGFLKQVFGPIVDSFDHTLLLWEFDDPGYLEDGKKHSLRWIVLPVSPTAEQIARLLQYGRWRKFHGLKGSDEATPPA